MARPRRQTKPKTAKPSADIYTALLVVALLAQVGGSVLLFFDYDRLKTSAPTPIKSDLPPVVAPTGGGPGPAAGPAGPANPAVPANPK